MQRTLRQHLLEPLLAQNPITVQALGICSALAVTAGLRPSLLMAVAVIAVSGFANDVTFFENDFTPQNSAICPTFEFHTQFRTEFLSCVKIFESYFLFRVDIDNCKIRITAHHNGPLLGI